ncbi:phage shock protein operon transcriptional activator [Vibrio sp. RC27]
MNNPLIGESPLFLALLDTVSRLAPIERPVLIMGERGTGKELIAQRLHYLSKRWDEPLITLNCAALSEGLIDSELFGHESGAFTGAKAKHMGRFERAEGGSLFLDELGNAPLSVQEKLLRVIEYGQYERIGGSTVLNANVRVIAATNADLVEMADQNHFRHDLLDRLAFDVIHLPPLRKRREDILPLANHFAVKMCHELHLSHFVGFSSEIQTQLLDYSWPGNIRELKNVVERAVYQNIDFTLPITTLQTNPFVPQWQEQSIQNDEDEHQNVIQQNELQGVTEIESLSFPIDFKDHCQNHEKQLIEHALNQAKFHQQQAAQLLGLSYHQLRGLIRKYAITNKFDAE